MDKHDGLNRPVLDIGSLLQLRDALMSCVQCRHCTLSLSESVHIVNCAKYTQNTMELHTLYSIYQVSRIYVILGRCANKSHIMFDSLFSMPFIDCTTVWEYFVWFVCCIHLHRINERKNDRMNVWFVSARTVTVTVTAIAAHIRTHPLAHSQIE